MASSRPKRSDNILVDYSPLFRIHEDGRLERLQVAAPIPPSLDPRTNVESKDVQIFVGTNVDDNASIFVRIFKPNLGQNPNKIKIPLMVYFHGGAFCADSTFSRIYHRYLNSLASQAEILIASVEYRLAPEHHLPTAYDDCWLALNWVTNHFRPNSTFLSTSTSANNNSTEAWLLEHADFSRIFLAGDSSGANIAHQMALRVGLNGLTNGSIRHISGIILFHPFFWGETRIGDEVDKCTRLWVPDLADKVWAYVCPASCGSDDPLFNPANDPALSRLGCKRVLIFVSSKDFLRDRGVYYKKVLKKSGWEGKAEVMEYQGEDHIFHLLKPSSPNAIDVMSRVIAFLKSVPASIESFSTLSRL